MSWQEILKGFDRKQLEDAYQGYLDCVEDPELKDIQDEEFETALKMQLEDEAEVLEIEEGERYEDAIKEEEMRLAMQEHKAELKKHMRESDYE